MMPFHHAYKYSVTIHTDDAALAVTMRALAWHCQESGNKQVAVAGTKLPDWQGNGHKMTFYFNNPDYRADFLAEAERLFTAVWKNVEEKDDNPAPRQN